MTDTRSWRRLAFAAALSGAAHAALVSMGRLDLPESSRDLLPPLAVRMVNVGPTVPAVLGVMQPQPDRRITRRQVRAPPAMRAPAPTNLDTEPLDTDTAVTEYPSSSDAAQAPTSEDAATEIATAPHSVQESEPQLSVARSLPRNGRITYNLVYGRDQFPVGRTVQTWEIDGSTYQLASRSETTGIVDVIRSQHRTFLSRGTLTVDGLRPQTFVVSRNRGRGAEEARAQFDWDGGSVRLGRADGQRDESLPPHSQDFLSFMYQLSLNPPAPGRYQQSLTNGTRLETYEFEVLPEMMIDTPLGPLLTLPVKQVRKAGVESLELWLAADYRYLPVRIRFSNRHGEPQGEQLVSEIRLAEE